MWDKVKDISSVFSRLVLKCLSLVKTVEKSWREAKSEQVKDTREKCYDNLKKTNVTNDNNILEMDKEKTI